VIAMSYNIYTASVQTILMRMEASTAHLYYATELQSTTRLSKPTVLRAMNTLCEAGIVHGTYESVDEMTNRAPRINYEFTPFGLSVVRLMPPST